MRAIDAEGARAVQMGIIDVALVRKVRSKLIEKEQEALRQEHKAAQERQLSSEIIVNPNFYSYADNVIGLLCTKLSHWFVDNIKQTSVSIRDINRLTTANIGQDFWVNNFNVKDLKTDNPQKCERVLKKWLKSH